MKGGGNGARGVETAGTNLLPLVDLCLASFVLSYFYLLLFHPLLSSDIFNCVETLKRKQQIMSGDQYFNPDLGHLSSIIHLNHKKNYHFKTASNPVLNKKSVLV